jgi:choloylglycine hydrolase
MCTNLMISVPTTPGDEQPQTYVSSRCLEMPSMVESVLYVVPAGEAFPLPSSSGQPFVPPFVEPSQQLPWTSTYGFVGIASPPSGPVPPFFYDGLNSAGLSAGALWLAPGTQYPPDSSTGPSEVAYLDFVAWLLGNFDSVAAARAQLESGEVTIVGPPTTSEWYKPLHFVVTDSTAASIIVEFVDGAGPTIYNSSNAVLTNTPTYDWHLTNIGNYFNLTLLGQTTAAAGAANPVGGGLVGLPGDQLSASRFVRAWVLSGGMNGNGGLLAPAIGAGLGSLPADGTGWLPAPGESLVSASPVPGYAGSEQTAVTVALQLVQICEGTPYGMLLEEVEANPGTTYGDYTQWTSVRDHTNLNYYFVSAFSGILTRIGLSQAEGAPSYLDGWLSLPVMPAPQAEWVVDGVLVAAAPATT